MAEAEIEVNGGIVVYELIGPANGEVVVITPGGRFSKDHGGVHELADALAEQFPGSVDPATVQTNVVCVAASALPADFLARLAELDVLAGTIDPHTIRFVTHKDVDSVGIRRAIEAFAKVAA